MLQEVQAAWLIPRLKPGLLDLPLRFRLILNNMALLSMVFYPALSPAGFPEKRPRFGGGELLGPEFVPPIIVFLATVEAKNITGQFFYASAGDIIIFNRPMQLNGPVKFIRKNGMWTLDELSQLIPTMVDS